MTFSTNITGFHITTGTVRKLYLHIMTTDGL